MLSSCTSFTFITFYNYSFPPSFFESFPLSPLDLLWNHLSSFYHSEYDKKESNQFINECAVYVKNVEGNCIIYCFCYRSLQLFCLKKFYNWQPWAWEIWIVVIGLCCNLKHRLRMCDSASLCVEARIREIFFFPSQLFVLCFVGLCHKNDVENSMLSTYIRRLLPQCFFSPARNLAWTYHSQ